MRNRYRTPAKVQLKSTPQQQVTDLTQVLLKLDNKRRPIKVKYATEPDSDFKLALDNHQFISVPKLPDQLASKILSLKKNQINTLKGIAIYDRLNYLDISFNLIRDIVELDALPLRVLIISNNRITQLSDLPESLTLIDAQMNHISRVHICNLKNLKALQLQKNQINTIDLSGLIKLQKLYLDDNRVQQLVDIPSLPKLQYLSITNNLLTRIFDNKALPLIPKIKEIFIQNNPITRVSAQENYLHYLLEAIPVMPARPRCKSVENKQFINKNEINEIVLREQSIPKLNIIDFNNNTPLPNFRINKQLLNQQMLQRILQKNVDQQVQVYKTEISTKPSKQSNNQFSIKQAKITYQCDSKFIKRIEMKSKSDIFGPEQVKSIELIKLQYNQNIPINRCVYQYYSFSKTLICYGNPDSIDEQEVQSVILKYFNFADLSRSNLFVLNKITQIILKHNRISNLYELRRLPSIISSIQEVIIEKNEVEQCTLTKQFLLNLYQLDDKNSFQRYFQIQTIDLEQNVEQQSITTTQFDEAFDNYITQLILETL